jgi:hypothetical protein
LPFLIYFYIPPLHQRCIDSNSDERFVELTANWIQKQDKRPAFEGVIEENQ